MSYLRLLLFCYKPSIPHPTPERALLRAQPVGLYTRQANLKLLTGPAGVLRVGPSKMFNCVTCLKGALFTLLNGNQEEHYHFETGGTPAKTSSFSFRTQGLVSTHAHSVFSCLGG